jgi:hypothetical protein
MTLIDAMLAGSIVSLLLMALGFVWLYRRGKMSTQPMSEEEAADFVVSGPLDRRPAFTAFKGKAWGMGMSASISTYEVWQMMKAGRWGEALPWLVPIVGALAAFFFWPMWIMLLCGASPLASLAFTSLFVYTALRAAWPRA